MVYAYELGIAKQTDTYNIYHTCTNVRVMQKVNPNCIYMLDASEEIEHK